MTGPQPAPLSDREPAGRLMEVDPGSLKIQSLCCELQRARATSQSQMQTNNSPKPAGRPRQRPRTCAPPPTPPHPQHSRPLLVPHGAQDEGWLPGPGDLCDVLQFCGAQGRVGRGQAGAGPPPPLHGDKPGAVPSPICPWREHLLPTLCKGSSSQNITGPLGSSELGMRRGAHCSRNGPPPSPASSRFSCFPPRAPKHKHPCPACCVSTLERFFMHASRCCGQPPSPESLSPIYR